MARKRYQTIGLGGTFDHFHDGHASFIKFASGFADQLIIGVTDGELTKHKQYANLIQPYFKRAQSVHRFCTKNKIKHQITKLNDPFGPTINSDSKINALAVTESTVAGGDKINEIRRGMKLPELPIHIHKLLKDEIGETLSAFRVRGGVVSRQGKVYGQILTNDHLLTTQEREFFQKIHGEIVGQPTVEADLRIAIGDITLEKFRENGWDFALGIFDGHSARQKIAHDFADSVSLDQIQKIANPAGEITNDLYRFLTGYFEHSRSDMQKSQYLMIEGEEDLATVATVLASPLQTMIYYGQPGQGLVELRVTEKIKDLFYHFLTSQTAELQ